MEHPITTIILAPLIGAVLLGFFGKRMSERLVGIIACLAAAVSTILSFVLFFEHRAALEGGAKIHEYLFTWISVGGFRADFSLLLDSLSGVYILFVTFVGFWIHVFATGYMRGEDGYWRFFAYLNLFMFMMLTLVLADNFLLMFVGWEGVGLCSYLLIGFYYTKNFANDAAKKAFVVNRIGDFGFALGVMLLFWKAGTIFFFDDPGRGTHGAFNWAMEQATDPITGAAVFAGGITTIAILLFVGATGKSAQLPLYVWLPDAMAGPTPVSALIHAATMVTAGVYMVSRASSIYIHAPAAMLIVAVIGAATALFAATIGLAQWDIKKVLAYSTVSQLGYMFLACGVGAFGAGIFHVFTHAFFKALLFLGSGSVLIGMHHEQDMRHMGGLRKYMPVTFATMLAGWLAISGFPFLSGFFSKDEILYSSFTTQKLPGSWPKILWFVGAVTALLTAIYMTRLMVLTFWGSRRASDLEQGASHGGHNNGATPHESPISMTLPLVVLAFGAVFAGYVGFPSSLGGHNYIERFLEPSIASAAASRQATEASPASLPEASTAEAVEPAGHEGENTGLEIQLMTVSTLIALAGLGAGWFWFKRKPLWNPPRVLEQKYWVDEIYDTTLIQPIKSGSTFFLWKIVDMSIIDGLVNGAAALAGRLAFVLRYVQSGLARSYVALVVFGALLLIGYFVIK